MNWDKLMNTIRVVNLFLLFAVIVMAGVNWWNLRNIEYPDVVVSINAEMNYTYDWEQANEAVNSAIQDYCVQRCTELYFEYHNETDDIEHGLQVIIECEDENCTCQCEQEVIIEVGEDEEKVTVVDGVGVL